MNRENVGNCLCPNLFKFVLSLIDMNEANEPKHKKQVAWPPGPCAHRTEQTLASPPGPYEAITEAPISGLLDPSGDIRISGEATGHIVTVIPAFCEEKQNEINDCFGESVSKKPPNRIEWSGVLD